MRLEELKLINYQIFSEEFLKFDGKSTIIFGINGTGKSTILSAIIYLNRVWINRLNPSQGKAFTTFTDDMITIGESLLAIEGIFEIDGIYYSLQRFHERSKKNQRKSAISYHSGYYAEYTGNFEQLFLQDEATNMPIFAYYGTNRSVLDIPDRIRTKHDFDKLSALESDGKQIGFPYFFEWYRDREANEVIEARESGILTYHTTHC